MQEAHPSSARSGRRKGPIFWTVLLGIQTLVFLPSAGAAPFTSKSPSCLPEAVAQLLEGNAHNPTREARRAQALLASRKAGIAHADIPAVDVLSICAAPPKPVTASHGLSAGIMDPVLERARGLAVFEDFKIVSDMRRRPLSKEKVGQLQAAARELSLKIEGDAFAKERVFLRNFIESAYEHPAELFPVEGLVAGKWAMNSGASEVDAAFRYTEDTWSKLLRETRPAEGGSLLASPYPVLVPAGRFQEAYYWDAYFGIKGLLSTGRIELAQMQVENFLSYVRRYGFVPNGGRDYYLSRSQPPFLSSMVREVYAASMAKATTAAEKSRIRVWLKNRAYPLIERDYNEFWMNPQTRLDSKTGLNHHWDDVDLPRPERHGSDNELALGKTYRDTRAGAESGLDFTDAFRNEPTQVAGPLLNSMLYKTEKDLAWFAQVLGDTAARSKFEKAALRRKGALDRFLWNPEKGRYEGFHLGQKKHVGALSSDTFAPLFAGAASPAQAKAVRKTLGTLEKPGGIMSSDLMTSTHQWDGVNGWAPYQVMAIDGLRRYGYASDAKRIARKWVDAVAHTHSESGAMFERIDVVKIAKPAVDAHKYPTQEGFLWTNGSFTWAAVDVLNLRITPLLK